MRWLQELPTVLNALAAVLWPLLAGVIFFAARKNVFALLQRQSVSIKVGGMEISAADAAESLGRDVADLQARVISIESALRHSSGVDLDDPSARLAAAHDLNVAPAPTFGHANFTVLWVDDHPENNAFLIQRFEEEGIEVVLAKSTAEALTRSDASPPDMVITDLGRREDGKSFSFAGLDLVRQIRRRDPAIPIAVFAGARGMQNREKLTLAGAQLVTQSSVELQVFVQKQREAPQLSP